MNTLVIQTSRTKWSALFSLAIGFVALGLWLVVSGTSVLVGWLNVAFFGLCAVMFARQLADRRPRLVVDDSGITDSTLGVGCIEWGDIVSTELRRIQGNAFLCLELRQPLKYLSRMSPVMREMTQANKALGFTELSVNLTGVQGDPDVIAGLIAGEASRRSLSAAH